MVAYLSGNFRPMWAAVPTSGCLQSTEKNCNMNNGGEQTAGSKLRQESLSVSFAAWFERMPPLNVKNRNKSNEKN